MKNALLLALLSSCSLQKAAVTLSYPGHVEYPSAPPQDGVSLATSILAVAVTDFDDPWWAADCMATADPARLQVLLDWGQCLARNQKPDRCEAQVRALDSAWLQGCAEKKDMDRARLAQALLDAGEAAVAWSSLSRAWRELEAGDGVDTEMRVGLANGLAASARTLKGTPHLPATGRSAASHPALALSGGAANGSFSAGYLHALLGVREAALARVAQDDRDRRDALDAQWRFAGAASTSVGTLVSLALDLYFTDTEANRKAALDLLRTHFSSPAPDDPDPWVPIDETRLLCARKGNLLQVLGVWPEKGRKTSVFRFDPLMGILSAHFSAPLPAMLSNDFVRVATAVDIQRNLVMPLDERTCLAWPDLSQEECVMSAALASIAEPVWAEPVPQVVTPFSADPMDGDWLDGGLQSGTPAILAGNLTHGSVLAVQTHRMDAIRHTTFVSGQEILFRTLGVFVPQTRWTEVGLADLALQDRMEARCRVARILGLAVPPECPVPAEEPPAIASSRPGFPTGVVMAALPAPRLQAQVLPIHVPSDVDPILAASGYTFDPLVMDGLYRWGERTFYESASTVFGRLGWTDLAHRVATDPVLAEHVASGLAHARDRLADHAPEWAPEVWQDHVDERGRHMRRHLQVCAE